MLTPFLIFMKFQDKALWCGLLLLVIQNVLAVVWKKDGSDCKIQGLCSGEVSTESCSTESYFSEDIPNTISDIVWLEPYTAYLNPSVELIYNSFTQPNRMCFLFIPWDYVEQKSLTEFNSTASVLVVVSEENEGLCKNSRLFANNIESSNYCLVPINIHREDNLNIVEDTCRILMCLNSLQSNEKHSELSAKRWINPAIIWKGTCSKCSTEYVRAKISSYSPSILFYGLDVSISVSSEFESRILDFIEFRKTNHSTDTQELSFRISYLNNFLTSS